MPVAPTVTRTMTTMATAVMDTDHTDRMRRHLDLERIGHMCVHTVPGGGDVISSGQQVQPTTKDCGIYK
jgi:hypothetical protein